MKAIKNMYTRMDYPRPQLVRNQWLNLNGVWHFMYDDDNKGLAEQWYVNKDFDREIIVPYTFQCEMSGVFEKEHHDIVWYKKSFKVDKKDEERLILHFGAVDYRCDVWVNGHHMVTHEGGHVPFSVEITDVCSIEENQIIVRAQDYSFDLDLPRGKQYWKQESESIFYTATTGIWQTVWIETVGTSYIEQIYLTPDLDNKMIQLEYEIDTSKKRLDMEVVISLHGKVLISDRISIIGKNGKRKFYLDHNITLDWNFLELWTWTPENPVLFDLELKLLDNDVVADQVTSYFGMRKVSIVDGRFMLNNRPYYQKLILDQGYWEESLLTAPSDEAFIKDIEIAKKMGFNGARKHQKIEDPRYLYHADRLGFLVWGETANAYVYSRKYVHRIVDEWMDMIKRDYNHPCIIAWTPLNESWGTDHIMVNENEQAHSVSLYYLTKSIDQTRPVISNDGWDHTKSDLLTIHDYEDKKQILKNRYASVENILLSKHSGRGIMAQGWKYENQPILVSEFGGISFKKTDWEGWGYSSANNQDEFINMYANVISAMLESPLVQGFCYTQLTDVEQEINGLLTYNREPKVDLDIIRQINEGVFNNEKTKI